MVGAIQWVADVQPVGSGEPVLKYLAAYVYRTARSNMARILMKEDYRGFATRLADSPLLQRFCGITAPDRMRPGP